MPYNATLQIRLDSNLKRQAEKIYDGLGMDLATAVRVFLRQSVLQNGLPFGMMDLDALEEACATTTHRGLLISQGRAYEVERTERTCRLASPATQAQLSGAAGLAGQGQWEQS